MDSQNKPTLPDMPGCGGGIGAAESSGSSLTNVQVKAVSQLLELRVHVLDDWASQTSPRCKG